MDDDLLAIAFHAHRAGQSKFTRRMAITIALMAEQTPKQIVLRCERLGLLKPGAWRWFQRNGGITRDHIDEVRQDLAARMEPG